MKITKERLRQLIKEELKRKVLKEDEDDRWRDYFSDKHKRDYIAKQYKDKTGKDAPSDPADLGREISKHYNDPDDWDELSSDAEAHSNNKKREAKIKNYNTNLEDRPFYQQKYAEEMGEEPDSEKVADWLTSLRSSDFDKYEQERKQKEGSNFVAADDIGTNPFAGEKKSKKSSSRSFRRSKDNNPSMPTPKKKEPSLADPLPDKPGGDNQSIVKQMGDKEIEYTSGDQKRKIKFNTAYSYCFNKQYGQNHPACMAAKQEIEKNKKSGPSGGAQQTPAEPQKLSAADFKSSAEKRAVAETTFLKNLIIKEIQKLKKQ